MTPAPALTSPDAAPRRLPESRPGRARLAGASPGDPGPPTPRAFTGFARAGAAVRDASGNARVPDPAPPGADPVRGGEPSHMLQEAQAWMPAV